MQNSLIEIQAINYSYKLLQIAPWKRPDTFNVNLEYIFQYQRLW